MTTREVYFKALYYSEKPVGMIRYFYEDNNRIIHTNGFIIVHFNIDQVVSLRNIKRMIDTEQKEGFLFWAISPEGEKFLEDNKIVLGKDLIDNLLK